MEYLHLALAEAGFPLTFPLLVKDYSTTTTPNPFRLIAPMLYVKPLDINNNFLVSFFRCSSFSSSPRILLVKFTATHTICRHWLPLFNMKEKMSGQPFDKSSIRGQAMGQTPIYLPESFACSLIKISSCLQKITQPPTVNQDYETKGVPRWG